MKKNVVLISILALAMVSFKNEEDKIDKSKAVVNQIDGFYIFSDSRPLMAYDTLGVVEAGFISGTQYHTIRTNLIKRSRKKYANADGIILDLRNHGLDQCIVIKFKQ
jgi:hypothetical protein